MSAENLRRLSDEECRALLRGSDIGRVGVSVRALPAIFPVRFTMVDDDVLFRTSRETLLARVVSDAIVAFEADAIDNDQGHGWSVLVVGRAEMIGTGVELEQVRHVALLPWTTSSDDSFVRIATDTISGRAFATP
jgi:nitroimidazol reductase NimA-like FMN-containing flavoprotein (pyridoxamine 5'-phosphate oxidase superfamily)